MAFFFPWRCGNFFFFFHFSHHCRLKAKTFWILTSSWLYEGLFCRVVFSMAPFRIHKMCFKIIIIFFFWAENRNLTILFYFYLFCYLVLWCSMVYNNILNFMCILCMVFLQRIFMICLHINKSRKQNTCVYLVCVLLGKLHKMYQTLLFFCAYFTKQGVKVHSMCIMPHFSI